MNATPRGTEVELLNDLANPPIRQTITSPLPRARLLENLLFLVNRQPDEDDAEPESPLVCCFHLTREKITWHVFALPGREDEAIEAVREGGLPI